MFTFKKWKIQKALEEYRKLCIHGCLRINCKRCNYSYKISSNRYFCKREELMSILWPKHKDEILLIEKEVQNLDK